MAEAPKKGGWVKHSWRESSDMLKLTEPRRLEEEWKVVDVYEVAQWLVRNDHEKVLDDYPVVFSQCEV